MITEWKKYGPVSTGEIVQRGNGEYIRMLSNVTVQANTATDYTRIWGFTQVSLLVKAAGASDITVELSTDGLEWYVAQTINFTGGGSKAVPLAALGGYMRIKSSVQQALTVDVYKIR